MSVPHSPLAAAMWSVAIPGFGQLYNRRFLKGALFIVMELLLNLNSHLNEAIYYSFLLDIEHAQAVVSYPWLLFYPCVYVFSIFDAYHDACRLIGRSYSRAILFPFFLTCYGGTVGNILASGDSQVWGLRHIGPVFFGAAFLPLGLGLGSWLAVKLRRSLPERKD